MQFDPREHFEEIVLVALDIYFEAENGLSRAVVDKASEVEHKRARFAALREGGAAALYLHHFSDIVATRGAPALPDFGGKVAITREWLSDRSNKQFGESHVTLLGDVADALKHAVLTRNLPREVEEAGQVLVVSNGFGMGPYGKGKFGGVEEVWILGRNEKRPLMSVLKSVSEVWKSALASSE